MHSPCRTPRSSNASPGPLLCQLCVKTFSFKRWAVWRPDPHLSSAWTTGSRCHRSKTARGAGAWPRWSTAAAPPTPPATAQPPGAPQSLQCRSRGSALPSECCLRLLQGQATRSGLSMVVASSYSSAAASQICWTCCSLTMCQMHSGSSHPCWCWSSPDLAAGEDQPKHQAKSNSMEATRQEAWDAKSLQASSPDSSQPRGHQTLVAQKCFPHKQSTSAGGESNKQATGQDPLREAGASMSRSSSAPPIEWAGAAQVGARPPPGPSSTSALCETRSAR